MITKTFVNAFIAASFMAGVQASPCKASSKTTDISTTVGITLTSAETAVSTTVGGSLAEDTTLTVSHTGTSTESSVIPEDITPTAVSTTALSSSIIESSIDTSTVPDDISTTAEGTTTAEAATTTTEVAIVTSFLTNGGFDDKKDTTEPWNHLTSIWADFSIDGNIKHDGRNSARLSFTSSETAYISQSLDAPIEAGISYSLSAWVRPGTGCTYAALACNTADTTVEVQQFDLASTVNQWKYISIACTWTQDQLNDGGLQLIFAFTCDTGSDGWVDTVTFSES